MKISFVIPSYERNVELQNCITSIERAYENAKNTDIEIVVIINGCICDTSNFKLLYPELTSIYHIPEKNVTKARNFGIEKCKGEYIVLIDDDATIKNDFIEILCSYILSYSKVGVFNGKIVEPGTNRCFNKEDLNSAKRYLNRYSYRSFKGSSIAIRKDILEKIGYYSDEFGPGNLFRAGEESDLFFKIKMANEPVLYVPDLIIYHPIQNKTPPDKVFNYSYATGALLAKYCIKDKYYFYIYIYFICEMLMKNIIRTIQTYLFYKQMRSFNERFHYSHAFWGLLKGSIDFFKEKRALKKYNENWY